MSKNAPKTLMLEDIERSGLTEESVKDMKLKPLTKAATGKLIGSNKPDDNLMSYQIPYFTIDGKPIKNFYRLRFLEEPPPGAFGAKKKPKRYTQPKDEPPRFYLPPIVDWQEIATANEVPLVITEGEKKAAAACQNGIPCIGLGGVWSWKSKTFKLPIIPDFNLFNWHKRNVYLCFDNDLWDNEKVLYALSSLAETLYGLGAFVSFTYLPEDGEKMGLDDYLLDHTVEDFEELETEDYMDIEKLIDLNKEWAVLRKHNVFINIYDREIFQSRKSLSENRFGNQFIIKVDGDGKTTKTNAFIEWSTWANRREHYALQYAPGEEEITENDEVNMWRGWGLQPEKGNIKPFIDLFNFVFGDLPKDKQEWVWKWLAYPIQNPGAKMKTAVLVHGEYQQTGKTFIGYIMGDIYGENFGVVDNDELTAQYNTWSQYKQFVLAEEVSSTDKRVINNKIKRLITGEEITLEGKHRNKIEINNTINLYFTSQHKDALYIEPHDARFFIHHLPHPPKPPEFYKKIDKWRKAGGAKYLMHHLITEVDCSEFNPLQTAPTTKAKEEMKRSSSSSLENWAFDLVHNLEGEIYMSGAVIEKNWFTLKELVDFYHEDTKNKTTDKAMANAISAVGSFNFQTRVIRPEKGDKPYPTKLWCIRHVDSWKAKHRRQKPVLFNKAVQLNYEGDRAKIAEVVKEFKKERKKKK